MSMTKTIIRLKVRIFIAFLAVMVAILSPIETKSVLAQSASDGGEPKITLSSDAKIISPTIKPDLLEAKTPSNLDEFYQSRLGVAPWQAARHFKLKAGEGLAPMLKRGGMTVQDSQNAIAVVLKRRNLGDLQNLPVGFGVDIILPNPDSGAENALGAIRLPLKGGKDLILYQNADKTWASQIGTISTPLTKSTVTTAQNTAQDETDSGLYDDEKGENPKKVDEDSKIASSSGVKIILPTVRPKLDTAPAPAPTPEITIEADKPDLTTALATTPDSDLPLASIGISLPLPRPDRSSLYPQTPLTLDEFYQDKMGVAPWQTAQHYTLESGEGLAPMLKRGGMTPQDAQKAVDVVVRHRNLQTLPIGFGVDVIPPNPDSEAEITAGALRLALGDGLDLTVYQNADKTWVSQISTRPIESFLSFVQGKIDTSLYSASLEAGMDIDVLNTLVEVLSFTVDFQREIRKGDTFEVLFENHHDLITDTVRQSKDLHYLSMTLSGKRIEYFRHEHANGTIGFYDNGGNSATRPLMRTPVNGARLSSGYGHRKHPILGYSKLHQGLDFAAPTGTPIMAAGSGVIESAGWNGSYGKYIRIRHNATYKTAYAHMSKIARGIAPGARVRQGQIIGFIGSTGRSTGPHLHYEILVNNRKTNPLTVRLPAGESIDDDERLAFEERLQDVKQDLKNHGIGQVAEE